ncbi:Metal tolerance C1 [Olea europaea subsp. europaea]|uniref:Metal tolerance C1 n=1 Tax=Olea europaea subsp. europaea TaxID=158383 RepID=A0A8S0TY37_OLEEU|nr:Metal tolerance C1 [Olea europaea subsp. europaea]
MAELLALNPEAFPPPAAGSPLRQGGGEDFPPWPSCKALTGYRSGSTAIVADAVHSISDMVLSGVALLSFKAASIPKDREHPYGDF